MATTGDSDDCIAVLPESKEGYMYREGNNKQSWGKRYFILREDKLDYFKTQDDKKVEGAISLTEGKGVREKDQCTCKWPSEAVEDYCFGLATKSQTWYFYTTSEEGDVGDWKRLIQGIINKVGTPDPDWKKDHEGKPEGSLSFMAKIGAVFTKIAMKFAPVDDRVKDGVTAGADLVEEQANADPDASMAERAAMGVKGGAEVVKGATGDSDVAKAANVVGAGADMVKEQVKADPEASMTERVALGVKGGAEIVKGAAGDSDVVKAASGVGAVADMVKEQAKADPDASMTERVALGVKGGAEVIKVSVDDDIAKATASAVSAGIKEVAKACKEDESEENK